MPIASTTGADGKPFQPHGITGLEHFRIRESGVGHVRLERNGPVESNAGATATSDRLVVLTLAIAEAQVVHRALTGRQNTEGTEEQIA